jgi:hypothetical protein
VDHHSGGVPALGRRLLADELSDGAPWGGVERRSSVLKPVRTTRCVPTPNAEGGLPIRCVRYSNKFRRHVRGHPAADGSLPFHPSTPLASASVVATVVPASQTGGSSFYGAGSAKGAPSDRQDDSCIGLHGVQLMPSGSVHSDR